MMALIVVFFLYTSSGKDGEQPGPSGEGEKESQSDQATGTSTSGGGGGAGNPESMDPFMALMNEETKRLQS